MGEIAMTAMAVQKPPSAGEEELAEALESARLGDKENARQLAWLSLRRNPRRESAWLLLASLVESREDQEMCLRQVLSVDPGHSFAGAWLAKLLRLEESAQRARLSFQEVTGEIPLAPPALSALPAIALEAAEPVEPTPAPPARPRVLVVDDSATVRRLVSVALERLGCEVITASGGLEALGVINHAAPDLVLLDVGLPHLDGNQICRTVKRNERTREVPVVMLTGRDGLVDRIRGRMAGATEYLTKPVDPQALAALVDKYLGPRGVQVRPS
jgi:twitching motility two-component system response regulator PilG